LWLYLNEQTDFFAPKSLFCSRTSFYKLFRKQKNLDYTTTDLFSPPDVADICNAFEDNQCDFVQPRFGTFQMIPNHAGYRVLNLAEWQFYKFRKI
jgi:hypothetical protein